MSVLHEIPLWPDQDIDLIVRKYQHSLRSMAGELQKIISDRKFSIEITEDRQPGLLYIRKIHHPGDVDPV